MHAVGRDARPRDGVMRVDPVTIVAAGVVTPIGADLDTFWSGLVDGRDGISTIERFRVDDFRVGRAGEIKHVPLAAGERSAACRATLLLLAAARDLSRRAALDAEPARRSEEHTS